MEIIDARAFSAVELTALTKKPTFDECELSAGIKMGIATTFGENFTAEDVVRKIVSEVRREGDAKLLDYTELLDKVNLAEFTMKVTPEEIKAAWVEATPEVVESLKKAIRNVRKFHEEQLPKTWLTEREYGSLLGQKVTALDSVGIYVPGGTASYPSSVIMNAVPAKVAGVGKIIMAVPPGKNGKINPYVLVVADLIGVDEIYKIGGAQAIAALAFGTATVPKVDKITGPGNIFVTLAKKQVYGYVDIDMLAGPSEILIIADRSAKANLVAADLLGQAEHDPLASAILVTDDETLAEETLSEVDKQLTLLPRAEIAGIAIQGQGKIILVKDMKMAVKVANLSAPEHLEVMTEAPFALLPYLRNAGAIFLGEYSPEPLGDYYAGPNHVLPTGGTAKFFSVLNVETFMKKSSIIAYSRDALWAAGEDIIKMAEAEGLTAHANAIKLRIGKE